METRRILDWSYLVTAVLFGLLFLLFSEIFRILFPRNKIPPGPKPVIFVGNIPQMVKAPINFMKKMTDYGEISTLYLGRKPCIVLNNITVAKEALVQNGQDYLGRPSTPVLDWIIKGYGIVMANGEAWKQQRKFALVTLRNFGLGKKSLEDRISEEAKCLVEEFEKHREKAFDPQHWLQNAAANIICSIVFGNRFDYANERFAYLLELVNKNIILTGSIVGQIFNMFPIIKYLPGPQQQIQKNANELMAFIGEVVKEHYDTLDRENLRDFLDAYIVEIERQKSNPDSTFFDENMAFSVADLFLAGTDTTSNTLRWGLLYLMEHPEIQERCYQEIARVIGSERPPTLEDRVNLHYVLATIHEVQRVGNLTPLGVVHSVSRDTQLRAYTLAKETEVFVNMTAILSDEVHWKFPNEFNPGNFLNDKGEFYKPESFMVFSVGPRTCLGEQLAKMELFLFFTSLLQHLKFTWPPGTRSVDKNGIFGIIRSPKPFTMLCQCRDL